MTHDLKGPPGPGPSTAKAVHEQAPDSQQEEKKAGAVPMQAPESSPIDRDQAQETLLNSREPGTQSLSEALVDDQLVHTEPKAAAKPAATPSPTAQNELQAPESSASSRELAPRTSAPLQLSDGSDQDFKDRAMAAGHADTLAEVAYVHLANKVCPGQERLLESAVFATLSFQKQMRPKDALERLALAQALMAHGRVVWLTKLATSQTDVSSIVTINEACDRASGTFMRLMRGIGEYRQPTNSGPAISIGQANLAQQQVVQNIQEVQQKKNVDERTRIRGSRTKAGPEALSAIREGAAVAPDRHLANSAVDEEHRPKKPGRKGANPHERPQTRRTVSRQRGTPETGEDDHKGTSAND